MDLTVTPLPVQKQRGPNGLQEVPVLTGYTHVSVDPEHGQHLFVIYIGFHI